MIARWTTLVVMILWIGIILWIASRPTTTLFPSDFKVFFGLPRQLLQYPYHFGVFCILAILLRRFLSFPTLRLSDWKLAGFSFVGCALVSLFSELLQFYVPTRTPAIRDLVLDQSGAMLGITLMQYYSDKLRRVGQ